MALISTGTHPKSLWPGIRKHWGVVYNEHKVVYWDLFSTESSKQAYEEDVEVTGFGLAPVKAEGNAVSYEL